MNYGVYLKVKRESLGISIQNLSKMSGIPAMTISNWEHGHSPPADKLDKVLEALGVSITLGKKN